MCLSEKAISDEFLSFPKPCFINAGTGEEYTLGQVARMVADVTGYAGRIHFEPCFSGRQSHKLLDSARRNRLGWQASINLIQGVQNSYQCFLDMIHPNLNTNYSKAV